MSFVQRTHSSKGAKVVNVQFAIGSDAEQDAFLGAFFKFVEAAAVADTDAISIRSDMHGTDMVRVVTFGDEMQADQFSSYWSKRRKWLGL